MSHDMLKNLPKGLVAAAKLIIETTVPVQTRRVQQFDEELKGDQHKLDVNKNGKIDAQDFKLLRRKKAVKEALESGVDVSDIVQFHSPMQSDLHEEIAVVVHRDARDGTIHVMSEGMKYKLKKGQVKEVSEELLGELSIGTMNNYARERSRTAFSGGRKPGESVDAGIKRKSKQINSLALSKTKINRVRDTGSTVLSKEEVYEGLSESTYEFDISGEHGNAAVDKLVKHANSNGIKAKVHTYDGPGGGNPVIHLSHKDPKVVHSYVKKHIDPDIDLSDHKIDEALKGAQHKIDANKNGKVDAHDFELLRKKKKVAEEAEPIDELSDATLKSYSKKALDQSKTLTGDQKVKRQVGARNAIDRLGNNTLAKEEVELDEARGRPKKAGAKEELEIEEGMEFEFEDRGIATVVEITESRIILAFDEGVEEFDIDDLDFNDIDEAHDGYKADSEKSKFNSGHRAKLMNPEGKVSYLSGKSYKTPAHAKDAAKFYGSIMHLPIQTMDREMSQYNKAYDAKHGDVKEEVELDEARGRPPKPPKEGQKASPAWQRHLERQNKGEDKEELEALGAQLRKAVSINKPVTFLNGEKKEVSPSHITKFEDHMEARPKTIDKQKFQNDAHASHDAFVKSVTAPVPKPQGGTSSIVKYR